MEEKAINILKVCAWLNLVVGILMAVSIWLAERVKTPEIMTGVIYSAAGIIGWAFLLVICSIAESMIEVRTNTAQPAKPRLFNQGTK